MCTPILCNLASRSLCQVFEGGCQVFEGEGWGWGWEAVWKRVGVAGNGWHSRVASGGLISS
jgi:hypothetical protein